MLVNCFARRQARNYQNGGRDEFCIYSWSGVFNESNPSLFKERFHKSGFELLPRRNVFTQEISEVIEGNMMNREVSSAK